MRCAQEQKKSVGATVTPIFQRRNIPYRYIQKVGHDSEVDAIHRVAEREKADMIVVGSRGLRGIKETLLGSTSDRVVHHANCPVLVVR